MGRFGVISGLLRPTLTLATVAGYWKALAAISLDFAGLFGIASLLLPLVMLPVLRFGDYRYRGGRSTPGLSGALHSGLFSGYTQL